MAGRTHMPEGCTQGHARRGMLGPALMTLLLQVERQDESVGPGEVALAETLAVV